MSDQEEPTALTSDDMLRSFVRVNNRIDGEITITLWVGGHIISGELIGHKRFMELNIEQFQQTRPPTEGGQGMIDGMIEALTRQAEAIQKLIDETDVNTFPEPRYIHLKDPVVIYEHSVQSAGPFWRGRLDSVDGWMFGRAFAE